MTIQNDERLLSILHAHGQRFLRAFDIPTSSKHKAKDLDESEFEEEWTGFGSSPDRGIPKAASDGEHDGSEQENGSDDFAASSSRTPDVTVFLESTCRQPVTHVSAKELRRSFMSSKVSKISMELASEKNMPDEESDDERTNTQNDTLLHRLVHTKLLSGSLNPELELDHSQRGSALAGRILELSGEAKLGRGESVFHQEQRNKAAKRVREGLIRKQRDQQKKALEEAKNLGNYHPTLKKLYDSKRSSASKRRRARGLRMGVGKFVGGTLKLSGEEIVSVTGSKKRSWDIDRREQPR